MTTRSRVVRKAFALLLVSLAIFGGAISDAEEESTGPGKRPECNAANPYKDLDANTVSAIGFAKDWKEMEANRVQKFPMKPGDVRSAFREMQEGKPAWQNWYVGRGWRLYLVFFDEGGKPLATAFLDALNRPFPAFRLWLLRTTENGVVLAPAPPALPVDDTHGFRVSKTLAKHLFDMAKSAKVIDASAEFRVSIL